jgi:hypothetical protein
MLISQPLIIPSDLTDDAMFSSTVGAFCFVVREAADDKLYIRRQESKDIDV